MVNWFVRLCSGLGRFCLGARHSQGIKPQEKQENSMAMNTSPHARPAAPEVPLGIRSGPGTLGLSRSEAPAKPPAETEAAAQGRLIVGEGIFVKGQIDSCDTLVVEGRVEASLEAAVLKVRKGGLFKGTAQVGSAEIVGSFDGDLTVDGLLVIEAEGHVSGTLRYRELRIAQGGRVSGDIDLLSDKAAAGGSAPDKTAAKARMVESAGARR
jgi:cytoskeletal protein CcmA (bactofilin family)